MNYCPRCKTRMPAELTVCSKCGGPLRTIGGAAVPGETSAAAGDEPALALQLAGLQHQVRRSRTLMLVAAVAAFLLTMLLVVVLVGLYFYGVMQYATVSEITVVPDETEPADALISLERTSTGKVEFVREGAGRIETLVDHGYYDFGSQDPTVAFTWASGGEDYTLVARYRSGWRVVEKRWSSHKGHIAPAP